MSTAGKYGIVFGAGLLLAALLWASYGLGREAGLREAARAAGDAPRDTVVVRQTRTIRVPAISATKPLRVELSRFAVYAPDSAFLARNPGDSLAAPADGTAVVAVSIEQAFFEGADFRAWVSGYRPRLDSLQVFPEVRTVTVHTPAPAPSRWSFGLAAGPGVFWGPAGVQPGIGVVAGVQFRF